MLNSIYLTSIKNIIPVNYAVVRTLFTSVTRYKAEDRREMLASMPAKDEGTEGEKALDIDQLITK